MKISEGQKIKLKTGEMARVADVLKGGEAFMVEVFAKSGGIRIETIWPSHIASIFVESELLYEPA